MYAQEIRFERPLMGDIKNEVQTEKHNLRRVLYKLRTGEASYSFHCFGVPLIGKGQTNVILSLEIHC